MALDSSSYLIEPGETADSMALRKKLALMLAQKANGQPKIDHWAQGLAHLADQAAVGMELGAIRRDEKNELGQARSLYEQMLAGLNGGGGAGGSPAAEAPVAPPSTVEPPVAPPTPPPAPQSAVPDAGPVRTASLDPTVGVGGGYTAKAPPGPSLLSANPAATHEVINQAKGVIARTPIPRSRPTDIPQEQPAAPQGDGMVSMRTPFGVNIPVKTSATLPKGLSPQAQQTFGPLVAALSQKGLPVQITSGYRDPRHNASVGGAKRSQHMHGNALDFSLAGMNEQQKRAFISQIQSNPNVRGFGYYPKSDSIHADVRPGQQRAAWGGNYSGSSVGQGWPSWLTAQTRGWQSGRNPQLASDGLPIPRPPGSIPNVPQQMGQSGGGVPIPPPRPPGIPQDAPPQPEPPEMANAPVRVASLGGMPASANAYQMQTLEQRPGDVDKYAITNPVQRGEPSGYQVQPMGGNVQLAQASGGQGAPSRELLIKMLGNRHTAPIAKQIIGNQIQQQFKQEEYETKEVGGQLVQVPKSGRGQARVVTPPNLQRYTPDIAEHEYNLRDPRLKQHIIDVKRAGATNLSVNSVANPILEGVSKQFSEGRDAANKSADSIAVTHEMRKQLDAGMFTGPTASWQTSAVKVARALGLEVDQEAVNKMTNSETFMATAANAVRAKIKAFGSGSGITDTDRDFTAAMVGGKVTLDENSMRRILDINERLDRAAIRKHNLAAEKLLKSQAGKELGAYGSLLTIDEPPEYVAPEIKPGASQNTPIRWERGPDGRPRPVAQ